MARIEKTLTSSYQQLTSKRCVITFKAPGVHYFNTFNSDTAALLASFTANDQVIQNEAIEVWAKTSSGEATIIVDEEA